MDIVLGIFTAALTLITFLGSQHSSKVNQAEQVRMFNEQQALAEKQFKAEKNISEKNFSLTEQQYEYQKQLNELQMQREDNAIQRQVADLKAAGLSPLMVSGGSSTGQYLSANAPQYDTNGIQSAIANMLGVKKDYAQRKYESYMFRKQSNLQMAQQMANLTSLKLNNEEKRESIRGQRIVNDYNEEHGTRDPSWQNAITDAVMKYIEDKYPNMNPIDISKDKLNEAKENLSQVVEDKVEQAKENVKKSYNSSLLGRGLNAAKKSLTNAGQAVLNNYNSAKNWVIDKWNKHKEKKSKK